MARLKNTHGVKVESTPDPGSVGSSSTVQHEGPGKDNQNENSSSNIAQSTGGINKNLGIRAMFNNIFTSTDATNDSNASLGVGLESERLVNKLTSILPQVQKSPPSLSAPIGPPTTSPFPRSQKKPTNDVKPRRSPRISKIQNQEPQNNVPVTDKAAQSNISVPRKRGRPSKSRPSARGRMLTRTKSHTSSAKAPTVEQGSGSDTASMLQETTAQIVSLVDLSQNVVRSLSRLLEHELPHMRERNEARKVV